MEEKEIKKIFGKYLMDVGEGEGGIGAGVEMAVASTLCETFKASLHQLLKNGPIDNGHLAIVELAIETKSSLCVQTSIDLGEVTALMPGGSPEAFLDIYHKFNSIVQFLDSNLENLKFGTRLSKEAVQKYLKQIAVFVHSRYDQLKSEGGGISNTDEINSITYFLNVAMQLILGEELFAKLVEETESIRLALEKIKDEVVIPRSSNARNKQRPN